jgi:hypothetical protein
MRANIIACLPSIGFFGRLPALDLKSRIASQEDLGRENQVAANAEVHRSDAYQVAVILSIGAAIISLF